jgi:4'-phosphopantetheinyl transferase
MWEAVAWPFGKDIAVWTLDLRRIAERLRLEPELFNILAPSEQQRAMQRQDPLVREIYVAAHVGLRSVLLQFFPAEIATREFTYTSTGKPCLRNGPEFNLSYSGQMALVAISASSSVGIDIERSRPVSVEDWFARYPALNLFASGGDCSSSEVFLRAWTRLEAWCKRQGLSLSSTLDLLDERAFQARVREDRDVELYSLDITGGYLASCAGQAGSGIVIQPFLM